MKNHYAPLQDLLDHISNGGSTLVEALRSASIVKTSENLLLLLVRCVALGDVQLLVMYRRPDEVMTPHAFIASTSISF